MIVVAWTVYLDVDIILFDELLVVMGAKEGVMILDFVVCLCVEGWVLIVMIAYNYVYVLEFCDRVNLI